MSLSLVAGLGNPGRDYEATRHNLGWVVLDAFAKKHGLAWKRVAQFEADVARWDFSPGRTRWLVKPLTFMNESGSAGGHNGVASLLEHLGDGFVRYRLGIGPKQPAQMDMADFVLGKFTPEQHLFLTQKLDHYVQGLDLLLSRGTDAAMNQLNRRDP